MQRDRIESMPDRREVSRVLRPYVDGTARGMSSWVMTERRIAATARDAAIAVLPLLGTPARSAHRVRGLIVPTLTCGWSTFESVYEDALTKLLGLPPAIPGVVDPPWDAGLAPAAAVRRDWGERGAAWTPGPLDAETTVGPSGTIGRLVHADRRRALVVADGRLVRTNAQCRCDPVRRRERGESPFELVTFRRDGTILDVRTGLTCALCRAPVP